MITRWSLAGMLPVPPPCMVLDHILSAPHTPLTSLSALHLLSRYLLCPTLPEMLTDHTVRRRRVVHTAPVQGRECQHAFAVHKKEKTTNNAPCVPAAHGGLAFAGCSSTRLRAHQCSADGSDGGGHCALSGCQTQQACRTYYIYILCTSPALG